MAIIDHKELGRGYRASLRDRDRPGKVFWTHLKEGFEKKHLTGEDFSIRGLFEEFVPDGRAIIDELFNPRQPGGARLLEAGGGVNTAAFSNITGMVVYNEIIARREQEEFVFQKLIPTVSTPFNGEKIAGITGLSDESESIEEMQDYPMIGYGEDWQHTPSTKKRGVIIGISKEAVYFDRTGDVLGPTREIANLIWLNKEKRAIDAVIDENTTLHRHKWRDVSYATYQTSTPWINVTASNALVDWTDLDAAEQTINGLLDPHTGEPILTDFTDLIVTKQLEATASQILNATYLETVTPGYATSGNPNLRQVSNPYRSKYRILSSRQLMRRLGTDTSWFLGNVSKAFRYMENWPLEVIQAADNSEADFMRDIPFRFKVRERGAYATFDPRAMHKSTVA